VFNLKKLDFLIDYLLKENKNIKLNEKTLELQEKKNLYRTLCNIREPNPISDEYLKIENEYLQEELNKKIIVNIDNIPTIAEENISNNLKNADKICIWQGDMTVLKIDAIVNPANSQGLGCFQPLHNCLDNQLNSNAGISLRLECNEIMKEKDYNLKTGEAIITKGYNLPTKYVIHTVGPIIQTTVKPLDEIKLSNCYINSLKLAIEKDIRNIAFPCISTGVFRFPKLEASKIAIKTVDRFLSNNKDKFDKVIFNIYSDEDLAIYVNNIVYNKLL
jgi:O-acetyl-ADP-ribose deacetylase (regulator of RNase III)